MRATVSLIAALLDAGHVDGISEAQFQSAVVALAHGHGWKVASFRAARVRRGGIETYETPVGADGKGWPDLVMVKGGRRPIFAELKSGAGKVSDEQRLWLLALGAAGQECHIWRPFNWQEIRRLLS